MSLQVLKVFRFLAWTTLLLRSSAFNLQLTEKMARFLISPVVRVLGEENASSWLPQLPPNVKPSFYGYGLNMFSSKSGVVRLQIGSPKMIDSNNPALQGNSAARRRKSKGSIDVCSVNANTTFFTELSLPCEASSPRRLHRGDNFGMTVSVRPDDIAVACSTTRIQDCGTVRYNRGSCFKSTNFGQTWNSSRLAKKLNCPVLNVEVLFVLDGSGSVGKQNFRSVKNWVKNISRNIGLDEERVTVGVVQYSHYSESEYIDNQLNIVTEIEIGEYRTFASFAAAVKKIYLHGYTTYTGHALQKVLTDFKTTVNYGKATTKQVMILLTDGKATDSALVPVNAEILRGIGVIPYAVGVGSQNEINRTELRLIANGDPDSDTRVFMSANFAGLDAIAKELEAEIGGIVLEGQGGLNDTGYKMQFGQLGFSIAYSKQDSKKVDTDVSQYGVNIRMRSGALSE